MQAGVQALHWRRQGQMCSPLHRHVAARVRRACACARTGAADHTDAVRHGQVASALTHAAHACVRLLQNLMRRLKLTLRLKVLV